jgi:hypothetical protein
MARPEVASGEKAEASRDEPARVRAPAIAAGVAAGQTVERVPTSAPRVEVVPAEAEVETEVEAEVEVPAVPQPAFKTMPPEAAPRPKAAASVPNAGRAGEVASPRPKAPAPPGVPPVNGDARRSGSLMDTRK